MVQLIGQTFPGGVVSDAMVQSGAKGKSDIIVGLAGRSRMLNEYVTGNVAAGNGLGCAPPSMMGTGPGHGHGGGADGVPILHTFASWSLGQGPGTITAVTNGDAPFDSVSGSGEQTEIFTGKIDTCFVPMCGPDGAYVSADLSVYVEVDANCIIYVVVNNEGFRTSFDYTFGGGGTQRHLIRASTASTPTAVRLKPGYYNFPDIRVTLAYNGTTAQAAVLQIALHQILTTALRT